MTAQVGDRDNYSGDISVTAPSGGYTRGLMYALNDSNVVARETAAEGAACLIATHGPVKVTKDTTAGSACTVGGLVYLDVDNANNKVTGAAGTSNTRAGIALEAAADAATEVLVYLQPGILS